LVCPLRRVSTWFCSDATLPAGSPVASALQICVAAAATQAASRKGTTPTRLLDWLMDRSLLRLASLRPDAESGPADARVGHRDADDVRPDRKLIRPERVVASGVGTAEPWIVRVRVVVSVDPGQWHRTERRVHQSHDLGVGRDLGVREDVGAASQREL